MSEAQPPTTTPTGLQKRAATPVDVVRTHLESPAFLEQIKLAMPTGEDGRRLVRGAITAMQKNPKIAECERTSIFTSMLTCAQLGLQLDGREAHLVPFTTKVGDQWVKSCTLVPDYKGLVRLTLQSDTVSFVHADVVCENDEFDYDRGLVTKHKINFRKDRGPIYCVYAFARFKDGGEKAEVMSRADVEAIRAGSPGANGKPWRENWGEMAKKTVFKRLCKWVPLSARGSEAVSIDNNLELNHGAIDVDGDEVPASVELPKRNQPAPRSANATVVDAGTPPPPETKQAEAVTPPAVQGEVATPPAKPKGLPRRQSAAQAATPVTPPPPAKEEEVPFIVGWMNEHKIMVPELQQALSEYVGEVVIDNVLRLPPEHLEFVKQNAQALADSIKGARVV